MKAFATWFAVALFFARLAVAAQHWPQFRGPHGSGTASDARPPAKFGLNEHVAWKIAVPWSPSSPCIWGEYLFLTTFNDGQLEVRCYDLADGRLRWARPIMPASVEEFHRSDGSPAASTPATDGENVVSYFGSFGLICHDFQGNERWRHPLRVAQSYGQYGSGTSPVIAGNHVLLNRDQLQLSSLLAVDLRSGKKLWETPRPEAGGSFGTPCVWHHEGTDQIVLAATAQLKGYELQTGTERWSIGGVTGAVCTTAVVGDGMLYFAGWSNAVANSELMSWDEFRKKYDANGDGEVAFDEIEESQRDYWRGVDANHDGKYTKEDWDLRKVRNARAENVLIAVKPGGRGDISETHVAWKYRKALPYVPSPLFYDGRLYFVRDGGLISSLDSKTGEPFYAQERLEGAVANYYASPVAANGRVYVASLPGILSVIQAGGTKPEIVNQVDFGARILATPALVGDGIYVRTEKELWAFR